MSTHEIVIIGANQAGVPMAHYLLKHTIPQLQALTLSRKYHVTMISPNTSFYWKIAGPRALVSYDAMPQDSILKPIAKGFESYPADSWAHVAGKASNVDGDARTVTVQLNEGGQKVISYGSLIIATGTHYESALWTADYGEKAIVDAQTEMQKQLQKGKSVIIAGGGPVGVETAGEIAQAYPGKKVILISGGKTVLQPLPAKVSAEAEKQLKAMKVEIINNKRVKSATKNGNQTDVLFTDGSEIATDAYINAFAGKPNVDFLPEAWLEKGHVQTDKPTMRATGVGAQGVYAIGDVHIHSNKQSMAVADSVGVVGSSLAIDVLASLSQDEKTEAASQSAGNAGLLAWLLSLFGLGGSKSPKAPVQKTYSTMENTQIVPIGKSGTGVILGWKAPGWLVYQGKGKSYLVNLVEPQVNGAAWAKP